MSPKTEKKRVPNITIENARLIYRNFSGLEGIFNAAGKRNFNVLIDEPTAKMLTEDGWNVKYLKPRDEEDTPQAILKVQLGYKNTPPKVVIINNNRKTHLTEETIGILDWAEIEGADLIITPYYWDKAGKQGITAYVKTMYVTLKVDELELKYHDVPDSAQSILLDDQS